MKPSLGRIVLVKTTESFNGSHVHPAIVTRVWGSNDPAEAHGSFVCVNTTVIPDCGAPFLASSVQLFETEEEAVASGSTAAAWWPPRV